MTASKELKHIPVVSAAGLHGVGGPIAFCRLAVAIPSNDGTATVASTVNFVDFEMMPARKSHTPRQGQEVPGAGAGMELVIKPSLTELKVPGARPITQAMGIAGEYVEFVGAFIGFDEYHSDNGDLNKSAWDNSALNQSPLNAWEKSQMLTSLVRAQKEVVLQMEWGAPGSSSGHGIRFSDNTDKGGKVDFCGQIKAFKRAYATPQRVYYWVQICITNRDDLLASPDASQGTAYAEPLQLNPSTSSNQDPAALADKSVPKPLQPQVPTAKTADGALIYPSSAASTPIPQDPISSKLIEGTNAATMQPYNPYTHNWLF